MRGAQEHPVAVVVAGRPGADKTATADLVQTALKRRGGAVRIGRDLYKPAHRDYAATLTADVRTASAAVRPDTPAWQAAVEDHVRRSRFDAVVESALTDLDDFRASSAAYRQSGYRIEIVVLATADRRERGVRQEWELEGLIEVWTLLEGGLNWVKQSSEDTSPSCCSRRSWARRSDRTSSPMLTGGLCPRCSGHT